MAVGSGLYAQAGFAKEAVKNTRQTPTQFIPFTQESLSGGPQFIKSAGLGGGLRYAPRKAAGQIEYGGSISFELQPETIIDLLELCLGGTASTTGAGPYVHEFEGGDLATGTFQIARPDSTGTARMFDYIGSMVNSWTLSQNPGEIAMLQVELFSYDELTNQTKATYAADASPTLLTFAHLTVNDLSSNDVCFDSVTLTGSNNLDRTYKSCAANAGKATIREAGRRTLTGTLSGDFYDLTAYTAFKAGTEGDIQLEWNAGASAKVTLDLHAYYTGETPIVDGEGVVKQGIGFEVIVGDGNDNADAITVTVTSTDTNA